MDRSAVGDGCSRRSRIGGWHHTPRTPSPPIARTDRSDIGILTITVVVANEKPHRASVSQPGGAFLFLRLVQLAKA
jgi:hypothetical protein